MSETAFRGLEATLQILADQASGIVFAKDANGRFIFMNKAGAECLGLALENIVGQSEIDLFGPTAGFASWESDHRVLATGKSLAVDMCWPVKGEEVVTRVVKYPLTIPDNGFQGIIGIEQDVTSPAPVASTAQSQPRQGAARIADRPTDVLENRQLTESAGTSNQNGQKTGELKEAGGAPRRALLALQSAMTAVSASLDQEHVVDTLAWEMVNLLHADLCAVLLLDQEKESTLSGVLYQDKKIEFDDEFDLADYPLIKQALLDRRVLQLTPEETRPIAPRTAFDGQVWPEVSSEPAHHVSKSTVWVGGIGGFTPSACFHRS